MTETQRVLLLAQARRYAATGRGRAVREAHSLSLQDLSRGVGTSVASLSRWERGQRQPRGEAALRYAALLAELEQVPA